jgi:HSP20 family protein
MVLARLCQRESALRPVATERGGQRFRGLARLLQLPNVHWKTMLPSWQPLKEFQEVVSATPNGRHKMKTRNTCNQNSFDGFSQDMERVFDSLLGRTVDTILRPGATERFAPSMDVSETEDSFYVTLDLPGVNPDEVSIEVHDGKLTISGNRAGNVTSEGFKYHRIERKSGEFQRLVSVPKEVDVEKIDAAYEHGVLVVTLPKVAKKQPTKIQIRTSN